MAFPLLPVAGIILKQYGRKKAQQFIKKTIKKNLNLAPKKEKQLELFPKDKSIGFKQAIKKAAKIKNIRNLINDAMKNNKHVQKQIDNKINWRTGKKIK
tara:strand:- start:338 stop:634 length:297 start_codon:yes stop_codon:yes gene_type:complete